MELHDAKYVELLARFHDHLSMRGLDDKTIMSYDTALNRFERFFVGNEFDGAPSVTPTHGGTGVDAGPISATQLDIANFKKWLVGNYASGTVDLTLTLVNAFYCWLKDAGHILDNPITHVQRPPKSPTVIRWLDNDEQNRVLREARRVACSLGSTPTENQQKTQLREYAIVLTFLRAGLRVEELCDLKISDMIITPRQGRLYIKGKGDKDRTVPISRELRSVLVQYLDSRRDNPSAHVFPSQRSAKSSTRAIQHMVEGYAERLQIPDLTCHSLRHTFGHDLAVKHIPLDVIARLMGHMKKDGTPNIAMTIRYTTPGMSDLENAVNSIAWD